MWTVFSEGYSAAMLFKNCEVYQADFVLQSAMKTTLDDWSREKFWLVGPKEVRTVCPEEGQSLCGVHQLLTC